jgi:ATP-dependent Clp protease ATP-binding subunit ClpC
MEAVDKIQDSIQGAGQHDHPMSTPIPKNTKRNRKKETALDFFATNLTDTELQKNIDPIIGRDLEIERLIQILCRRTKNNPVLLGDPGVGKTAIVEGLAKRILQNKVPDILLNKKIYSLDMGLLIAGTIYRGEFEDRLRQVIDDVANNPNIILFIDELHNIVGAGSNQGTMDAANILKPALARGQIRCIGSTTLNEFKKHIENDAALERRFQPIFVKEPTLEDSIKILEGIKTNYEIFHNIKIDKSAVEAAVRLSDRYVSNKFLPDKAIDLLDETASAMRINSKNASWIGKIERLKQKLEKTTLDKEAAALADKFDEAVKLKNQEEKLRQEIEQNTKAAKDKKVKYLGTITKQEVLNQIAKIIGSKPSELMLEERNDLLNLEKKLKESVVGQDQVVHAVAQVINRARLGLNNQDRPLASLLFVGESGVGKTELAKTLAAKLYPGKDALIKLDMSEFNESFGVSKLLGSPAGYIGYKESNNFTDKIKNNPHCVVLFDEIDKAHKDVTKLLLQILENGEITDSTGKKISLKHAIIILTTSLGSQEAKRADLGFADHQLNQMRDKKINEKLKEYFSPEIINRLDKICLFDSLSPIEFSKIAALEIKKLNERLANYKTKIEAKESILSSFISSLPQTDINARTIRRELRTEIEKLMAEIILNKKNKKQYTLEITDKQLFVK